AWISARIFGVVVACLCSLMSISLLPDELLKKLLGGQQRITSMTHLIIRDPTARLIELRPVGSREKLFPQVCSFEGFKYPKASLISACSSLFFCDPVLFSRVWDGISQSLMPGGVFCGHFMGPDDSWAKLV
ncbi:hypothetical protein ACGTN6_21075, partial [Halomonas sp. THAF12]